MTVKSPAKTVITRGIPYSAHGPLCISHVRLPLFDTGCVTAATSGKVTSFKAVCHAQVEPWHSGCSEESGNQGMSRQASAIG
jgi:hypothetical protein